MFNIFPISIGDVLRNSGITVNKDMEYFFYEKEIYFLNSCISENFVKNILRLDFSEFLNSVFSEFFKNTDVLNDKVLKVNDALLKSENRTDAINKISVLFNDNADYLIFPPLKTDYLCYKVFFRCASNWYNRYFNKEDFQFAEEKLRNCTILKLFNNDKFLLLDILKNALNDKQKYSEKYRIQRIMDNLITELRES